MRKTIYIPSKIAEKIKTTPNLNISRICRDALAKVLDEPEQTKEAILVSDMSTIQNELDATKAALEAIARKAAKQANMTLLSEEDTKLFREMVSDAATFRAFVHKTRRKAVEDYKKAINEKRQVTLQQKKASAVKIQSVCVVCGQPGDTTCNDCGRPLCWFCWTGDAENDPENANERCPDCMITAEAS